MQIPFEQDIPADPIAPGEPLVADQAAKADIAPIEAPTVEPVDPSAAATPDEETTLPGTSDADTDAARRRITMQLYSRMVTDLKVLTGDTRVPTDDEIDDALNRAMRAHGLGSAALHGVRGVPPPPTSRLRRRRCHRRSSALTAQSPSRHRSMIPAI